MKQIQINTTTNSGWVITSHYEFDEKNNKMKSKRLDDGRQVKDFHDINSFPEEIRKGIKDGTIQFV